MVNGFPNVYPQLPTTNTELNVVYTSSDNENPSLTIAQTVPSASITPENAKAQFQKRLEDNYPVKLITNYSLLLMISNLVSKN